jgi:asparagine synthase (glutamine-hydrolysing)
MIETMKDRGPDDSGLFVDSCVGLAHTRLSILDLSPAGRCPMRNEDGTFWVVFNGEIYNFGVLRGLLTEAGHTFTSRTDTEVLIHGYEEWGIDLLARIDGMFSFAIWDSREKSLLLARDRLGEKPLFYTSNEQGLTFASTLNAIRTYLGQTPAIDPGSAACFLVMTYIPGPETIFKGINQLRPGHYVYATSDGTIQEKKYWDFPLPRREEKVSDSAAEELFEHELKKAVDAQMIADVPVGGFLSGGLDSSLIMSFASRHSVCTHTFCIGFQGADIDERPFARKVAERFGCIHHDQLIGVEDVLDVLPGLVGQYGQPFGDSSCIPTYFVSKLARQHVTVCLSGDGGDEALGGYRKAQWGFWAELLERSFPPVFREDINDFLLAATCGRLPRGAEQLRRTIELSLNPNGNVPYYNDISWLRFLSSVAGDELVDSGVIRHFPEILHQRIKENKSEDLGLHPLHGVIYDDYKIQLPYDFLTKLDVASMAASLEVRAPFLHRPLLEFIWRMPKHFKIRFGVTKWLARNLGRKLLPPEIIKRPKVGFSIPAAKWWRDVLGSALEILLQESELARLGLVRLDPIRRALFEHRDGIIDHSTRLWVILCLELWIRLSITNTWAPKTSLRELFVSKGRQA